MHEARPLVGYRLYTNSTLGREKYTLGADRNAALDAEACISCGMNERALHRGFVDTGIEERDVLLQT